MVDVRTHQSQWLQVHVGRLADVIRATDRDAVERGVSVRNLRGNKMNTKEKLFDEFAAALQFPEYFGENWNALDDCLADLSWWPADSRRLFVSNAAFILVDDDAAFSLWLDILRKVAEEWSQDDEFRNACPFDVVLHVEEHDGDALMRRLRMTGGSDF